MASIHENATVMPSVKQETENSESQIYSPISNPIFQSTTDTANDSDRIFWKEPITLEKLANFRTLQAFPTEGANIQNLDAALDALVTDISPALVRICEELKSIKVWPLLYVRYESANPTDENFKSIDTHLPIPHALFERWQETGGRPYLWQMEKFARGFRNVNAKFIREKSGLILAEIYALNLNIVQFNPLDGSMWSPLPKFLANKKAIINVHNTDNRCFGYAIASALHPVDHEIIPTVRITIFNTSPSTVSTVSNTRSTHPISVRLKSS